MVPRILPLAKAEDNHAAAKGLAKAARSTFTEPGRDSAD